MKKSLYAIVVVLLSAIGANALASMMDKTVEKISTETTDGKGTGNGSGKNGITRET